ncbi:MAG: transglycosylase SLT domain-containing protein [Oscillospiraceae bacterium]
MKSPSPSSSESSYKPDAVSDTGDFGLMQINVCNHRWLYEELGITDVMDPEQNIKAGIYILGQAFQKYDDPIKLAAYNMGDSGMKAAWSKNQHSSKYNRAVLETAQASKGAVNELEDSQSILIAAIWIAESSRPVSADSSPRWHWSRPVPARGYYALEASGLSCWASLLAFHIINTFSRCSRTTERR